jgi:glyoxylate/hydroxypyruvate reductase
MQVLLTCPLPPKAMAKLKSEPRITLTEWTDASSTIPRSTFLKMAQGKDGILILIRDKMDAEAIEAIGPQLRVISTMSVGYDHIHVNQLMKLRPNAKVGITPDVLTDATAELTVGLLLATARRFQEAYRAVKDGEWGIWSPLWMCGSGVAGKVIGIIGFGRIGAAVASLLTSFKPNRIVYSSPSEKPNYIGAVHVPLNELLSVSDYVVVTCKLNDTTRHLINASTLSQMKPTAILINTARGGIVNQDDL